MRKLLIYLFIVFGLGLTLNVNSNAKEINKEFYKFKKIMIPLSKDGSWKLIGKKTQSIYDAQLNFKYLAQTKDGQLSRLIELVHVTEARESPSQTFTWFKNFLYQTNGFSSCIPKNSALREKYYVYEESENSNGCFFTRNMDIEKEILYPTFKRETKWLDTNHLQKVVKKNFNDETKFPKIMLRSDHYFFTQRELYAYFEMINPEVNGAPNTLFKSEKKSEYHPLNIDNHPQKKNFYLTWIKNQAEKHSKFETELKRKNKINLAKYIDYEPSKDFKDSSSITQTVKKESNTNSNKIAKTEVSQTPKVVKKKIEEKEKIKEVIKSVSNEKKLKKIVKSSDVNFYKIKQGDYIDNPIVSITKINKISLPKGIWQVVKKSKTTGWSSTDNVILINQPKDDSSSFGEFIEIAVTKPTSKGYARVLQELKKPCKKKYYFHDLQKTSGSGNSFSCFATGFVENKIFQLPGAIDNPWNYKFKEYFLKKGTLTDNILFSLSAYGAGSNTKSKLISVVYGSSLNFISDKNKIDIKNEELIKNIWTQKTINFHNNFQNDMNFKESHMVNFDAEYQNLENKYADLINVDKTKRTVKKEIKIKTEKKKVKVAKAEDQKQEEFEPKTKKDNDAPVIEIADTITMGDSDYEFKGKVTDQAKTVFIEVDGYPIEVSEGTFTVKGYSPVDKQISIIAIDQHGNKSQPKLVNIIIDQKDTIVADLFETLDPSNIKTESNEDRVALIIGIEKYDQTPEASFANLDAKYFFDYSRKAFGVSKSNIKLLVDEDANLIKSLGTISKWLPGKIKDGETELIIFFAGHGLASSDGKELYLLPQDGDPDLLERTALSRTELFKEIISLNPKSVTMFLDTCYSGVSRDEKTLLASARPVRIVAEEQEIPNNFTIFSASQLDQISSGLKEAKHGIFSYYLMKGLEGKADSNQDKKITNGELLAYMDENVSQKASELGRQQNPSLAGDPNKILMSYR